MPSLTIQIDVEPFRRTGINYGRRFTWDVTEAHAWISTMRDGTVREHFYYRGRIVVKGEPKAFRDCLGLDVDPEHQESLRAVAARLVTAWAADPGAALGEPT